MQPSPVVDGIIYYSDSDRSAAAAASGSLGGRAVGIVNHFFNASFVDEYDKAAKIADRLNIALLPHSLFYNDDFEPTENFKKLISIAKIKVEPSPEINLLGYHLISSLHFGLNHFEDKNQALQFLQEASHQFGWDAAQEPIQDAIGLTAFFSDEEEDFILNLKKLEVAHSSGTSFKKIIIIFISQKGYEKFNSVMDKIEWADKLKPLFQCVVNDLKSSGFNFNELLTTLVPEIVDQKVLLVEETIQLSVKNTLLETAQSINVFIDKLNIVSLANRVICRIKDHVSSSFDVQRRIDPILDLKLYLISPEENSLDCAYHVFSLNKKCGNLVIEASIIKIFEEKMAAFDSRTYVFSHRYNGYITEQIVKYLKKDLSMQVALINIQEFLTLHLIDLITTYTTRFDTEINIRTLVENGALASRITARHLDEYRGNKKRNNKEYNRHEKYGQEADMSQVTEVVERTKLTLNTPNRFEIFFK